MSDRGIGEIGDIFGRRLQPWIKVLQAAHTFVAVTSSKGGTLSRIFSRSS